MKTSSGKSGHYKAASREGKGGIGGRKGGKNTKNSNCKLQKQLSLVFDKNKNLQKNLVHITLLVDFLLNQPEQARYSCHYGSGRFLNWGFLKTPPVLLFPPPKHHRYIVIGFFYHYVIIHHHYKTETTNL